MSLYSFPILRPFADLSLFGYMCLAFEGSILAKDKFDLGSAAETAISGAMGKSKGDSTQKEKDKKARKSATKDKKRDAKNEKGRKSKKRESVSSDRTSSSASAEVDDDWKQQTVMIAGSFGLTLS